MAVYKLDVYLKDKMVGKLCSDNATLSFAYTEEYLSAEFNIKLSASLPLEHVIYKHNETHAFFSGLLPDESVRSKLAEILSVSEKNVFALLERVGGECAGAISLYPEGEKPSDMPNNEFKVFSTNDADNILSSLDKHPMLADDENIRISGAGAQNKLMISFKDDKIAVPLGSTPSTHIIKPAIQNSINGLNISDSVHNELFCMKLAKEVGLPVPDVNVYWLKDKPYYVIDRYDRIIEGSGSVIRLHQEDFCQALNIAPEMKYENENGPSIKDCFDLISGRIASGSMAGMNKITLLQAVIFNYLVGNGDAHGKNFSILYKDDYEELAPFYDILSTVVYGNRHKDKMAMKIGSKYKFKDVQTRHLIQLGVDVGFKETFVKKQIHMLAEMRIGKAAQKVYTKLNADKSTSSKIYDEIMATIIRNSKQILSGI
ncbi:MAG: serine/threonine-protein kinase HipA [Alphaproteobacteria bacterium]|jgi:serine/threonine-protein kinase HipA